MLKFCEFLHRIRVIFYLRFRPLDVPMYAFGTKNEDFRSKSPYPPGAFGASENDENKTKKLTFRSKSPYPLSAFEGSSSFFELELPSCKILYIGSPSSSQRIFLMRAEASSLPVPSLK